MPLSPAVDQAGTILGGHDHSAPRLRLSLLACVPPQRRFVSVQGRTCVTNACADRSSPSAGGNPCPGPGCSGRLQLSDLGTPGMQALWPFVVSAEMVTWPPSGSNYVRGHDGRCQLHVTHSPFVQEAMHHCSLHSSTEGFKQVVMEVL